MPSVKIAKFEGYLKGIVKDSSEMKKTSKK